MGAASYFVRLHTRRFQLIVNEAAEELRDNTRWQVGGGMVLNRCLELLSYESSFFVLEYLVKTSFM